MAVRKLLRIATLGLAALLVAPAVHAVDGVFEINDTSVMAAGG